MPDDARVSAPDPFENADPKLRELVEGELRDGESVVLASPYDLDTHGRYILGMLVLTADRLGAFTLAAGWQGQWRDLNDLESSELIEGLGVKLLRLHADGEIVADYRCSLRHARELAGLQRRLERKLAGEDEDEDIPSRAPESLGGTRCTTCGKYIPRHREFCPNCTNRGKMLLRLMEFIRPHRAQVGIAMAVAILLTLVGLIPAYLRKPLVDKGLGAGVEDAPNWDLFLLLFGVMAGLRILLPVCQSLMQRLMAGLAGKISRDVRDRLYHHMHDLSLSFFSRKQTGQLVTRITSDTERLWDFVSFTLVELATSVLTLVGGAVMMFMMNWKLATFALIPIPIMFILIGVFHKHMRRRMRRHMFKWGKMTSVITNALPGVRVIKAFNQEDREVRAFRDESEGVYDQQMKIANLWMVLQPTMTFCANLGELTIWLLGGWWVVQNYQYAQIHGKGMDGGVELGMLMAFMGFMNMFYQPIRQIAHIDRRLNRAATSTHRIFEILDTPPAIFSVQEARDADSVKGGIEVRNVSFSYDGVRRVLRDINFTVEPGQMIGLAGPSGSGKTTLINLICRFYDVLDGEIRLDGTDVRDYELGQLRRSIGMVLQEPFLFHGTVAENIAYGNPNVSINEIIESARVANAHNFIVGFPDGYETMVGERGQTLSGGERQRISIARAIINNPKILILDEATSSVDSETESLIQEALERLVANRTTIAIAHRLSTLRKADKLVILNAGELVETGTHDELAEKEDGLYAKLLSMQAETQSLIGLGDVPPGGYGGGHGGGPPGGPGGGRGRGRRG
jgi:ATP-binding cassette subfamily B protein